MDAWPMVIEGVNVCFNKNAFHSITGWTINNRTSPRRPVTVYRDDDKPLPWGILSGTVDQRRTTLCCSPALKLSL